MSKAAARNPRIFIAYAPRAGLRCAMAYLESSRDLYGWFRGTADGRLQSRYFVLQDYFTPWPTRYLAVEDGGLHTEWIEDDARCHELAEMQDAFEHEWLAGEGVRADRLSRFSTFQPSWTYASPAFDSRVLEYVAARWPLDYGRHSARVRAMG
jgi:hypothetical protein